MEFERFFLSLLFLKFAGRRLEKFSELENPDSDPALDTFSCASDPFAHGFALRKVCQVELLGETPKELSADRSCRPPMEDQYEFLRICWPSPSRTR